MITSLVAIVLSGWRRHCRWHSIDRVSCSLLPDETSADVALAFTKAREFGRVVVDVRAHDCPTTHAVGCADSIASVVGYVPCAWREVDRQAAFTIVSSCMHCDLAYRQELLPLDAARDLASRFLSLFGGEARFFTNGEPIDVFRPRSSRSWFPITAATFDAGVIAVSPSRVGIFWVEDED